MRADVDHLRLFLERQSDHWTIGVRNHTNGEWLYRAQCTSQQSAIRVLLDFASSELGRAVWQNELHWLEN